MSQEILGKLQVHIHSYHIINTNIYLNDSPKALLLLNSRSYSKMQNMECYAFLRYLK